MPFEFFAVGTEPADGLIVFLPGRGDDMGAFTRAGFIETLHQSDWPLDAVVADAHLGYYYEGVLAERIYQDILLPFQQRGYKRIFIVGTSLGGYGALWIDHQYGDLITGTILIAPYLGKKPVLTEIESSGGTREWRSKLNREPEPDDKVWFWIDDLSSGGTAEIQTVILAFGNKDKFRESGKLLSHFIPETRVFTNDGGHDWKSWHSLWLDILNSDALGTFGYTAEATNKAGD